MNSKMAVRKFAYDHNLTLRDVNDLLKLADLAYRAGVKTMNTGDDKEEQKYGKLFDEKAASFGFTVSWPGLYPVLYKDGYAHHLP